MSSPINQPYTFQGLLNQIADQLDTSSEKQFYHDHPDKFLEKFGHPWSKQIEIIKSVRDHKITTARSCNDVGKTWVAAGIVWWWMYVFGPDAMVITTSKNWASVRFALWSAIRQQYQKVKHLFNNAKINLTDFEPDPINSPKWFVIGFNPKIEGSQNDPEAEAPSASGYHSKHLLFLIDEAMTTPPAVFNAFEGSLMDKGSKMLCIFNPTNNIGEVIHYEQDKRTNPITISVYDLFNSSEFKAHPERYTELANPEACQNLIDTYGKDSPIIQSRVFGVYPQQTTDAAINYQAVVDMMDRSIGNDFEVGKIERIIYSWDVAGKGDDSNELHLMLAGEKGIWHEEVANWKGTEHTKSMTRVFEIIRDHIADSEEDIKDAIEKDNEVIDPRFYLIVDAVGEGSHVPSFMREWIPSLKVISFKGGEKAQKIKERKEVDLGNKNSEAWYRTHLLIEGKINNWLPIAAKISKQCLHELTSRNHEWKIRSSEPLVYFIEPKDKYKERNRNKSPDKADAFVMAVYALRYATSLKMQVI